MTLIDLGLAGSSSCGYDVQREAPMRSGLFMAAIFTAGVMLAAVAVGGAPAAKQPPRILGSASADVLKGTPKADAVYGLQGNDRLFGYGGNDRLYGGAGNDLLVGGAGADLLDCGAGTDIAQADATDTVRGCETVKGLRPAPPPEPTTTEETTTQETTTTAAPPPPSVPTGKYCGFTGQGVGVCVDVSADGTAVTGFRTGIVVDCQPASRWRLTSTATWSSGLPLGADLGFSDNEGQFTYQGRFDTAGNVSGTLRISDYEFDDDGTHYSCKAAETNWQAKLGA